MAYDDSRFRGESLFRAQPGHREDGDSDDTPTFADESPFRPVPYSYGSDAGETDAVGRPTPSQAQLEDVFDDPAHGEPGRDRLQVHLLWELLLILAAGGLGFLIYRDDRAAVGGDQLRDLMVSATVLGLLLLGMGISLRAASPNLAVGAIAYASAIFFTDRADGGPMVTAGLTVLLALAVGAVIAALTAGLHVPAWAASLGATLGLIVWIGEQRLPQSMPDGVYDPTSQAMYWLAGFVALAVLGGGLGAVKSIRRMVGRFRPVIDPARRRGGAAAGVSVAAVLGSSALACAAGILLALQERQVAPPDGSLTLTGLALGGALLGGTSAFGRRGGLLGAAASAVLLTLVMKYFEVTDRDIAPLAVAAVAIGVGLAVTRLVEAYGRPRSLIDSDTDAWVAPAAAAAGYSDGWNASRPGGWTSSLPVTSTDDRWGSDDSWRNR